MGIDLFNLERITARTGLPTASLKGAIGCLFTANVTWPLIYDTIYGHQDAKDDAKAGVKNIVLAYRGKTMPVGMHLNQRARISLVVVRMRC